MTLAVTHGLVAVTPDDPAYEIRPSHWNASHSLAGTADVNQGGTGSGSLTANELLFGNGTSAIAHSANFLVNDTTGTLQIGAGGLTIKTASGVRTGVFLSDDTAANLFVGGSGNSTLSGTSNSMLGLGVGVALTSGTQNFGLGGLKQITSGVNNVAVGAGTLDSLTDGISNIGIGAFALGSTTSSIRDVAIGDGALFFLTSGYEDMGIGYQSGLTLTSGVGNILIGVKSDVSSSAANSRIVIGGASANPLIGDTDHQTFLGDSNNTAWVPGATGNCDVGRADRTMRQIFLDYTNSATVGNVTINKISGTCNLAALASTLTVTNSLVTAASRIMATLASDPGVALSIWCVGAAGSFTVNTRPATINQTAVDFVIFP